MALAQLLNRSCNSPDVVFRTIRDFLAAANGIDDFSPGGSNPGPGYEIVDASYASGDPADTTTGDWCVMRSYGEAGTYPTYIRINFGATAHDINIGLGWDAESHMGFAFTARTSNIYHNGVGDVGLYVYADLDEIHIIMRPRAVTTWYWHPCARIKSDKTFYDGTTVQVTEPIQAGPNVEIVLPAWPGWAAVGRKIYCWDQSRIHEMTITAASEANRTITVDAAYDKSPGAWLAEDMTIYTNGIYNAKADDARYLIPSRSPVSANAIAGGMLLPNVSGMEGKYGSRYGCDIWLGAPNQICGRVGNVMSSRYAESTQGAPWTDDDGQSWRLHTVYNNIVLAFREAI